MRREGGKCDFPIAFFKTFMVPFHLWCPLEPPYSKYLCGHMPPWHPWFQHPCPDYMVACYPVMEFRILPQWSRCVCIRANFHFDYPIITPHLIYSLKNFPPLAYIPLKTLQEVSGIPCLKRKDETSDTDIDLCIIALSISSVSGTVVVSGTLVSSSSVIHVLSSSYSFQFSSCVREYICGSESILIESIRLKLY